MKQHDMPAAAAGAHAPPYKPSYRWAISTLFLLNGVVAVVSV